MVALQIFGVPGGVELLVILLIALILFGVPLVLLILGGALWLRTRGVDDERIEELEREVSQLRAELRDEDSIGDGSDGTVGERTQRDDG